MMNQLEWWIAAACGGITLAILLSLGGCETAPTTITIPLPAVEYSEPPK